MKERLFSEYLYWWRLCCFKVCGHGKAEVREKKLKITNALHAVQAAKEEGIVPGKLIFIEFHLVHLFVLIHQCITFLILWCICQVVVLHYYMPRRSWTNCKPQIRIRRLVFKLSRMPLRFLFPLSLFLFQFQVVNPKSWALCFGFEKWKGKKKKLKEKNVVHIFLTWKMSSPLVLYHFRWLDFSIPRWL